MTTKVQDFLRDHWAICLAILGFAVAWGANTAQLASLGMTSARMEAKLDNFTERVTTATADNKHNAGDIADLRDRLRTVEARR